MILSAMFLFLIIPLFMFFCVGFHSTADIFQVFLCILSIHSTFPPPTRFDIGQNVRGSFHFLHLYSVLRFNLGLCDVHAFVCFWGLLSVILSFPSPRHTARFQRLSTKLMGGTLGTLDAECGASRGDVW